MKSYFLEDLRTSSDPEGELTGLLPRQGRPWLIEAENGDPVAYLNLVLDNAASPYIQADVSGRRFNADATVLAVLRGLRARLGGTIRDDDDNEL